MAGGIFAGVEEGPGETIIYEGRKFKTYRGMGSIEAMKQGSGDRYFQDPEEEIKKLMRFFLVFIYLGSFEIQRTITFGVTFLFDRKIKKFIFL